MRSRAKKHDFLRRFEHFNVLWSIDILFGSGVLLGLCALQASQQRY